MAIVTSDNTLLYASPRVRRWIDERGSTRIDALIDEEGRDLSIACSSITVAGWNFGQGLLNGTARTDLPDEYATLCYFQNEAQRTSRDVRIVGRAIPPAGAGVIGAGLAAMAVTAVTTRSLDRFRRRVVEAARADVPTLMHNPRPSGVLADITEGVNESLERARASVEQQRVFVADVAHELRTPLSSLITTLEVAERHPQLVDPVQVTQTSLVQARRLERLTQDLLLLAQVDARTPLRQEVVDLTGIVDRIRREAFAADTITVHGTATPVRTVGDRSAFDRIVQNLVDNAVRHAETSVQVSLQNEGPWVRVTVSNDGAPIPDDQAERIFERFTRLDAGRARDAGGTGLGLAIARGLAERHGGRLFLVPHRRDGAT
ncbi:MAG: HAMP domain-containing histidine kinase, partial [Propionibacteriales bacterium]|nr:HAMP domain-containing histidine kinase [Propionibacteriales bacterium]